MISIIRNIKIITYLAVSRCLLGEAFGSLVGIRLRLRLVVLGYLLNRALGGLLIAMPRYRHYIDSIDRWNIRHLGTVY